MAEQYIERIGDNGDFANVPAIPVQKVQTKFTTAMAVQIPRDLKSVERRAIEEASMLGSDAFYAWGEGKDRIEGVNVKLAMALVRIYGNCAIDMGDVQDTRDAWIFTATFVDLETGFTLSRQFRQSKKWVVHGRFDEARKDDIRFQIGQSKAVRNAVMNAVPAWMSSRALDSAKGNVRGKIEEAIGKHGMERVIEIAIKTLADLGVPVDRVLQTMGVKLPGALTVEDLVILSGNAAALKSKSETIDDLFPIKQADAVPAAPGTSRADSIAAKIANQNTRGTAASVEDHPAQSATTDQGAATKSPAEAGSGTVEAAAAKIEQARQEKATTPEEAAEFAGLLPDQGPTNKPQGVKRK